MKPSVTTSASTNAKRTPVGYGVAAFDGRFTATPELGVALSDAAREVRLGWRFTRGGAGDGSLDLSVEAARRESANDTGAGVEPEHTVGMRIEARF